MFAPRLRHFLGTSPSSHKTTIRCLARILATDQVDSLCVNIFESRGHKVDLLPTMSEKELITIIPQYDGLVVRSATKVTANILQNATKLRIVGRAGGCWWLVSWWW